MNKLIHGREKTNFSCRIPNKLCRFHPKKGECNSPLLKCGLCIGNFVQNNFGKVGGVTLQCRTGQALLQLDDQGFNMNKIKSYCYYVPLIWRDILFPQTDNPRLIRRKKPTNSNRGASYNIPDQYSSKLSRSSKTRKVHTSTVKERELS